MKKLPILSMPIYKLKLKKIAEKTYIFDVVRKKYLILTPEEWVRQNFIQYLNIEKNFPLGLIGVENMIKYNNLKTRADIVIYNSDGHANIIVECKAPDVKITQETFYQIAKYNSQLKVQYLIVTNGRKHYCCEMDYLNNEIRFLKEIPNNKI
ncbi:MAG: restriction endonuclease subunit R [Flavobacteriales bacterium]|nr:restriction endonuclease subunit R [Flavobacteriales bacterium]|tara:strand:- start:1019 stop:1474 length:456 start_codon:yes stop_codon:yes gene_type:complete